jgi:hypothetical protein
VAGVVPSASSLVNTVGVVPPGAIAVPVKSSLLAVIVGVDETVI